MTAVAVVGLGAMGSRIARRLLGAGHRVTVWNRTADKAAPLVEQGARRADTPAAAAAGAEAVLIMVADPTALRDVTDGPDGIASAVDTDTTVVQMSTVGPAALAELEAALPAGTPLLDAPVLGSLTETEAGTLKVFLGGPPALVDRWLPLFRTLGTPMSVGPLGAGTAAKLVANTTLVGTLSLLGETLALAHGLGLDTRTAFDVLATTPLAAAAERRRASVLEHDYPVRFFLALARKDGDLILEAARSAGVDARVAAAARAWFADAERAGLGDRDYSQVLEHVMGEHRPAPPAD